LDEIFSGSPLPISVKTRVGYESTEEFAKLLGIYNRYPIKELTIHPRTRKQFYSGGLAMEEFEYAVQNSTNPLCFNGDILSKTDISELSNQYPSIDAVMIGRGLIASPGMLTPDGTTPEKLQKFMDELLAEYTLAFGGSRNAMFRLKENWGLILPRYPHCEKLGKQLRKTTDLNEYHHISTQIFAAME
jgi:tRNA-dihydrouridine synthase